MSDLDGVRSIKEVVDDYNYVRDSNDRGTTFGQMQTEMLLHIHHTLEDIKDILEANSHINLEFERDIEAGSVVGEDKEQGDADLRPSTS